MTNPNVGEPRASQPILQWHAVNGANQYEVWVRNPNTGLEDTYTSTTNSAQIAAFPGTSVWQVRARNTVNGQVGNWSSQGNVRYIEVNIDLDMTPPPLSPSGQVDNRGVESHPWVTLEWTDHQEAERYQVEVELVNGLTTQLYIANTNNLNLGPLNVGYNYYWRVRAQRRIANQWISGYWSPQMTFYLSDGQDLPDLVISDIRILGNPSIGDTGRVRITLRNNRATPTAAGELVQVKFRLGNAAAGGVSTSIAKAAPNPDLEVWRIYNHTDANLNPLVVPGYGTVNIEQDFTVNWQLYFVEAEANPSGAVTETNDGNNRRYETFWGSPILP